MRGCRVALVNPAFKGSFDGFPMGILYLAAALEETDHEVRVLRRMPVQGFRISMRRLPIHLPQGMFPEGRHQMHQQVKRGNGKFRRDLDRFP